MNTETHGHCYTVLSDTIIIVVKYMQVAQFTDESIQTTVVCLPDKISDME